MRSDFQEEILKFILQTKEGKKYSQHLEKELWDSPLNQTVYELYSGYVKKFNGVPSKVTLMEFFDRELKKKKENKISQEVYREFEKQMYKMYEPYESDPGLIKESILEFAQRKMTKLLFRENVDKVKDGDEAFFKTMYAQMAGIVKLKEQIAEDKTNMRSGFLLRGYDGIKQISKTKIHPTFLRALNSMTSDGGFFAPQLILLMGGPKSFKTGFLINLSMEFVRDGLKVYYADAENGVEAIKRRFYQAMLQCDKHELKSPDMGVILDRMVKKFMGMGGDFECGMFPSNSKTLDDVDSELEFLRDEYNWVPDVIVYDYLKLFKSTNPKITEPRLVIQDVFYHAKRLNVKWNTFAISVAKVKQTAINKAVIDVKDFGDDFEQAYNCDAAFAVCRTPEEKEEGIARLVPVVQREGVEYNGTYSCLVKLDMARMHIEEIDFESETLKLKNKGKLRDE